MPRALSAKSPEIGIAVLLFWLSGSTLAASASGGGNQAPPIRLIPLQTKPVPPEHTAAELANPGTPNGTMTPESADLAQRLGAIAEAIKSGKPLNSISGATAPPRAAARQNNTIAAAGRGRAKSSKEALNKSILDFSAPVTGKRGFPVTYKISGLRPPILTVLPYTVGTAE